MRTLRAALLVGALSVGCATEGRPPPPCAEAAVDRVGPIVVGVGSAQVWWSSESAPFSVDAPDRYWFECPRAIAHAFERQMDLSITAPTSDATTVITLDPGATFQSILGTGISMEESSVANLKKLSPSKRTELLTRLFDPARGMGLSIVRVTLGTSDFTGRAWYTYDDLAPGERDPSLAKFDVGHDVEYGILDVLREIRAISRDVLFFASPWSPPAWMKVSGTITGGSFATENVPTYAAYLRRFVEAYRDAGIPIHALTLQNEPGVDDPRMPSCIMSAEQEAALAIALKHELLAAGLSTKIWIFDDTFARAVDYASDAFADPAARAATDGVAFHDYGGDPSAMSAVHGLFPEKDMVFTEKTLWGVAGVDRVAQYFRNGSISYVAWVTMLDQHGLPNDGPNSEKPRRFVRSIEYTGDEYYATAEHYLFALYSKLVQRGARVVASDYGDPRTVTDVAFANPDGTIVVVVANQSDDAQDFALRSDGNEIRETLPPKTAGAYVWRR